MHNIGKIPIKGQKKRIEFDGTTYNVKMIEEVEFYFKNGKFEYLIAKVEMI